MKHVDSHPRVIVADWPNKWESFDFNWNDLIHWYKMIGKGVDVLLQQQKEQEREQDIKWKS